MSLTTKDRVSTPTGGDNRADRLAPGVWKVVCVAAIGSFMAQLDATVVNVSLASLAADLNVSLSAIQWVTSGYLLALALMLPLNGWLVDRIGAKALYLWCFAAFTLASALCGLAWSANSLIAFRILQGMSGGLLAPMAQMMIARAAGRHMARVVSVAALPVLLAPLLGPVIAGAILQFASWRWLFLINLPVGVLALALAAAFLPNDREETRPRGLDLAGLALLSPGLVLFLYGSDHLDRRVGLAALAISVILFALFYRAARAKGDAALIDLRLLRSQAFSASIAAMFMVNGIAFAGQMLIPIYLVRACGLSPSYVWLAAGAARARHDVRLSLHGPSHEAVRHSQARGVRRAVGSGGNAAAGLFGSARPRRHCAGREPLPSRRWRQRDRHSLDRLGICVGGAQRPADGDDRNEHHSAPRRPDVDDALRDLPRVAIVSDARSCIDVRRLRRGVRSALRPARAAVPRHAPAALAGPSRRTRVPIAPNRPAARLNDSLNAAYPFGARGSHPQGSQARASL